jgi:hypothetical protein
MGADHRMMHKPSRSGHCGGWLPSGIAGRAQNAGVFDRIAACFTAVSVPKPDGISSSSGSMAAPLRSAAATPPSTRPNPQSHCPVRANDT